MKKMYWQANKIHPLMMSILCVVALLCLFFVETHKKLVPQDHYSLKLNAAILTAKAFKAIKTQRLKLGLPISKHFDPARTGLIGKKETSITSDHGVLRSKQISVNPNIAALIVQWFKDINLKPGDTVAIGMTGSFPALDISTLAVCKVMQLNPVIIVSAAASQWGANLPQYSWLDMLHTIREQGILPYKPLAASIGGAKDTGAGFEQSGLDTLLLTIKRYDIPLIKTDTVSESIDKRMSLFELHAGESPIKAYINIGGGIASIGKHFAKSKLTKEQKAIILSSHLKTGVNTQLPVSLANSNSVAVRFLKQGIPVINIKEISHIAKDYNLRPWQAYMSIGAGALFFHEKYNIFYAFISLMIIIIACFIEVKIQTNRKREEAAQQLI